MAGCPGIAPPRTGGGTVRNLAVSPGSCGPTTRGAGMRNGMGTCLRPARAAGAVALALVALALAPAVARAGLVSSFGSNLSNSSGIAPAVGSQLGLSALGPGEENPCGVSLGANQVLFVFTNNAGIASS